jgi:heme oxygenase
MNAPEQADADRLTELLTLGTEHAWRATGARQFAWRLREPTIDPAWYLGTLQAMHPVFQVLEERLASARTDPRLAPLSIPGLARTPAIEADLDFFGVTPGRPTAASLRYVAHLHKLAAWSPLLLVAHAWVRTGSLLEDAEALRAGVRAAFGLTTPRGTALFDFPAGVDFSSWRATFDGLPLAQADREMLVAEAVYALELGAALCSSPPVSVSLAA